MGFFTNDNRPEHASYDERLVDGILRTSWKRIEIAEPRVDHAVPLMARMFSFGARREVSLGEWSKSKVDSHRPQLYQAMDDKAEITREMAMGGMGLRVVDSKEIMEKNDRMSLDKEYTAPLAHFGDSIPYSEAGQQLMAAQARHNLAVLRGEVPLAPNLGVNNDIEIHDDGTLIEPTNSQSPEDNLSASNDQFGTAA